MSTSQQSPPAAPPEAIAAPARGQLTPASLAIRAVILLAATAAVMVLCSIVGIIPLSELTWQAWGWRLIRLVTAAVVGAGLAAGGMALQGMLRNPLAEPYILGISSGAGVGVLVGMAGFFAMPDWASRPTLALAGALVTCGFVYGIAQRRGRLDPYVLILSGVIVNAFNAAIMLAIYLFVKPFVVAGFAAWSMGSIDDSASPAMLGLSGGVVLAGWGVLLLRGASFNALSLGDDVAGSIGVRVHWLRVETFLVVGVMTAVAVTLAGPIGFLGLIVPHVCRLIGGVDHRALALLSGFIGAMFLMAADTICRTAGIWLNIGEVPVGILTAFMGGPFFIFLLRRRVQRGGQ